MLRERPSLDQVAELLSELSQENLTELVRNRLLGRKTALPGLARDEDPTDILVDSFRKNEDRMTRLQTVCGTLLAEWTTQEDIVIVENPEPLGELLYMAARIRATEAIPLVATLAGRDGLSAGILSRGEDLQNRALRSLSGLLAIAEPQIRSEYRGLYENALNKISHAPIGLTTLTAFWPEEKEEFVQQARSHGDEHMERVIEKLDVLIKTFPTSNEPLQIS